MPWVSFQFSVIPGDPPAYVVAGRGFTRHDLLVSLIAACGHQLTQAYWAALGQPLWRVIEAIEALIELEESRGTP